MNVEEVKLRGPSLPLDVHWGHFAYSRFLERHSSYSVAEGDVLIFLIGHFPRESAMPLCAITVLLQSQSRFATNRGFLSTNETELFRRIE